jgi:hypothetical protein
VLTCRDELLDRTLIWSQAHLLHAMREFEQFYNAHRPHQGIANARPLPTAPPLQGPALPSGFTSTDATASAASSTSTGMALNLHG